MGNSVVNIIIVIVLITKIGIFILVIVKIEILIISDSENRNINISDIENNSMVTNNVVNSSIGGYRANLSNFLNNEYENIYVTWNRLFNFLLGGRDADIIDLNYKKKWDAFV